MSFPPLLSLPRLQDVKKLNPAVVICIWIALSSSVVGRDYRDVTAYMLIVLIR